MADVQYSYIDSAWKSTSRASLSKKRTALKKKGYHPGPIKESFSLAYGRYYFFYLYEVLGS